VIKGFAAKSDGKDKLTALVQVSGGSVGAAVHGGTRLEPTCPTADAALAPQLTAAAAAAAAAVANAHTTPPPQNSTCACSCQPASLAT
jgi:hypothetical protein